MTRGLFYVFFMLVVTMVWLYARFPAQAIGDYAVGRLTALVPGLELSLAGIGPGLPLAVDCRDAVFKYRGEPALALRNLRLAPEWQSCLPGKLAVACRAAVGAGMVAGRFEALTAPVLTPVRFSLDLNAVQLAEVGILTHQIGRSITGLCSGDLVYAETDSRRSLRVALVVESGSIEVRQPLVEVDRIGFDKIEVEVDLQGRALALKRAVCRGPDFDGEFSGTIDLKVPMENSRIAIRGTVRPQPVFLAKLRQRIPERLMPKPAAGGGYPLQLTGTLAKSQYRFQ